MTAKNLLVVNDLLAKRGPAVPPRRSIGRHSLGRWVFIELDLLRGAERLAPSPIFSLLRYGADSSFDPWFSILNRPA